MNYKTAITTAAIAAAALLITPTWAQDVDDDEEYEEEEEVEEEDSSAESEWKKFADMGVGVYNVKLEANGAMKSCIIVGQARISKALGKAKGLMNAKAKAKQSAEAAFVSFLKVHVSDVRESAEATELHISGVDEDGEPIEEGESMETQSQITTSQAQGQLRGMQMIAFDQDAEGETLTQVYAWKPAFAAASAGAAGAMNTADAAPGKAAPTGIDGGKKGRSASGSGSGAGGDGSSGNGKKKIKIKNKTRAVKGAEEFL